MIKFENTEVVGWEPAIRGMRNPKNSWDKSDSFECHTFQCNDCEWAEEHPECEREAKKHDNEYRLGPNDYKLAETLANGGPVHAKYRRMIVVYVDITAPLYWWKEFDTYKVGTVANSCSTMHKIAAKEFTLDDFSHEHLIQDWGDLNRRTGIILPCSPKDHLIGVIASLNLSRQKFLETNDKIYWRQMIQLLPSSYNQRRTVMLNYEVLAGIYPMRKDHKLDEWHDFCDWIKTLPYSELIICDRIFADFKKHYPELAKHVLDYAPGPQPNTLYISFDVEAPIANAAECFYVYDDKKLVSL